MLNHTAVRPHIVFAYHGCDEDVGNHILRGGEMVAGGKSYDWLGYGLYFWEADPSRAMKWASEARERHRAEKRTSDIVRRPYVLGAVIHLGRCLDLTTFEGVAVIRSGFESLKKKLEATGEELPRNTGGEEMKGRYLDCAVLNQSCTEYLEKRGVDFDTVRAVFLEGKVLYENAGFREKTHTQICVRRQDAVIGFFRVKQPEIEGF
jgi:hypothetical protein